MLFLKYKKTYSFSISGIWNGIWSDIFIETTFMRYGHGPRDITGITLKAESLKTWALGLHICSRLEQDIADITEGERVTSQETDKKETTARIRSVAKHRESIRIKLDLCIDPLNPSYHPTNIVNIVSGKVADDAINAQDAVSIGTEAMKEHERQ